MDTLVVGSLGPLAPSWDRLVEALPLPSPFLRSWWLEATAGPRPCFVLVVDGSRLAGGLALERDTRLGMARLRFMGAGPLCPDHLDVVAAPGREPDVLVALARWLARPGSRLIDLDGVPAGSRLAEALPGRVWAEVTDVAPWSPLPADPARYEPGLTSRFRNTLRRSRARLARQGAHHRVIPADECGRALETLRRLHHQRWGDSSSFLPSFDRFAAAAAEGVRRREVVLHELATGSGPVAVEVWFELAGRASFYQSGRDVTDPRWRGAGTVLRAAVIERACRLGFSEVDLLRGDDAYKRDWAPLARPLSRLRAAHGPSGHLALAARRRTWRARSTAGRP
jgi:CelD/BcsL family acetyltransferase involved in cellulose biosynthesis